MISICIPVYNRDITKLVTALEKQIHFLEEDVEINVVDDVSSTEFKVVNRVVLEKHSYLELTENIGRARIRNLLVKRARYDNLIFLDCDMELVSKDYLSNYMKNLGLAINVICGGLTYTKEVPLSTSKLRWFYGVHKECSSVIERSKYPYNSFMTGNFCVRKKILEKYPFDETLSTYGHEDTLLGIKLKEAQEKILHIHNPSLHVDRDTNEDFVKKTESAIANLVYLVKRDTNLTNEIKLLKWGAIFERYKVTHVLIAVFKQVKPILRRSFVRGTLLNLKVFDFYKLGFLLETKYKRN